MADSKLVVDFRDPGARSAALAAIFDTPSERAAVEAKLQAAEQCAGCGAHPQSLQVRAVWEETGNQAVLKSLEGYCTDCTQVLDLTAEDLLQPQKAMQAASWLAAVNDWSFAQTAAYLQEKVNSGQSVLSYDTTAMRASLKVPEVDLFEEPALDAAENWEAIGGREAGSIGVDVEEEIGEVDVLAAVNEAQAESSAPSVITYVPEPRVQVAQTPVRPPVVASASSEDAAEARVASVVPSAEVAVVPKLEKRTNRELRIKMVETAMVAAANYYAEMTAKVQQLEKDKALAAWEEAHRSTDIIQHILWTRYHDLRLNAPYGKARVKVRIIKVENQPTAAIIQLNNEQWRLRVINNYPGHKNIWELAIRQRQGQDWNGINFDNEQSLMEYFAQHMYEQLAEAPRMEADLVVESHEASLV